MKLKLIFLGFALFVLVNGINAEEFPEIIYKYYLRCSVPSNKPRPLNFQNGLQYYMERNGISVQDFESAIISILDSLSPDRSNWPQKFINNEKFGVMLLALSLYGNKEALSALELAFYRYEDKGKILEFLLYSGYNWYPLCKDVIINGKFDNRFFLYNADLKAIYSKSPTFETELKIAELLCIALKREIDPDILLCIDATLVQISSGKFLNSFERKAFYDGKFNSDEVRQYVQEREYLRIVLEQGLFTLKNLEKDSNLSHYIPMQKCLENFVK